MTPTTRSAQRLSSPELGTPAVAEALARRDEVVYGLQRLIALLAPSGLPPARAQGFLNQARTLTPLVSPGTHHHQPERSSTPSSAADQFRRRRGRASRVGDGLGDEVIAGGLKSMSASRMAASKALKWWDAAALGAVALAEASM